ncbi:MAG: hypothetical protein C1943_14780 [Halochromatium sp.]|nr:hypothetical protein [Halochromatium sp.]
MLARAQFTHIMLSIGWRLLLAMFPPLDHHVSQIERLIDVCAGVLARRGLQVTVSGVKKAPQMRGNID